jgi:hypothetical protein
MTGEIRILNSGDLELAAVALPIAGGPEFD